MGLADVIYQKTLKVIIVAQILKHQFLMQVSMSDTLSLDYN